MSQQIIDTIAALDDDANSLQRLANVVLREYSLTLSVVRTANSAHYRRTTRPIQSATHAMMMLGARTVRHLASSLLLFENYSRHSEKLRELMLLSLLTANHARETATRLGTGEGEEAHLCGMFRNLGEVLVACHFPDDYAAIQTAIAERRVTAAGAANSVLGFRYEALGMALAKHWGMPASVITSMSARAQAPLSDLGGIVAFSHDLTIAVYRTVQDANASVATARGATGHDATARDAATRDAATPDAATRDAKQALDEVIALHAPRLRVSRAMVLEIVEAALNETRELFTNASSQQSNALRQLARAARTTLGEPVIDTGEWDAIALEAPAPDASQLLRERLRQELVNKVDPASEASLGTVFLLALEAALRGGAFDRVIACVLSADRAQLTARYALGNGAEALMARFDFPMTPRGGPVAAALLQRQAVYVPVDRVATAHEAAWMRGIGAAQFGVFPIIVSLKLVGCLYVDHVVAPRSNTPRAAADFVTTDCTTADQSAIVRMPDREMLKYVASMCELIARAIAARRSDGANRPMAEPRTSFEQIPSLWSTSLETSLVSGAALDAQSKGALVLRLLQGEDLNALAEASGVSADELERWRAEFLAGALSRMG